MELKSGGHPEDKLIDNDESVEKDNTEFLDITKSTDVHLCENIGTSEIGTLDISDGTERCNSDEICHPPYRLEGLLVQPNDMESKVSFEPRRTSEDFINDPMVLFVESSQKDEETPDPGSVEYRLLEGWKSALSIENGEREVFPINKSVIRAMAQMFGLLPTPPPDSTPDGSSIDWSKLKHPDQEFELVIKEVRSLALGHLRVIRHF